MSVTDRTRSDGQGDTQQGARSDSEAVGPVVDEHNQQVPTDNTLNGLRLLFAVDSRFPGLGGAERQALKLAKALRERGALVEFVTPRILNEHALEEVYEGFTIKRIDYPHIRWIGSLVLMIWFARYLMANRHRFDALHIHITHLLAASAGYMRRYTGLPVTTKISGFYEFEGGVLDQRKRFMPLNFLIRRGLSQVDHVQTISEQTRDKLLQAGFKDEQISFIPNGIDTRDEPCPVPGNSELVIGYCGRLRDVKGVHVLLEGFAMARKMRPDCAMRLSIAGTGETEAALKQQAQKLGIQDFIDWLGMVDNTEHFYRSIDMYVQPSFAEGLPNSVMEAMVEQRPVIASDIGGNNELVDDGVTGLRFTAGNAGMLADQMVVLIDNRSLRDSLAAAGRQLIVERFGFNRVVDQLAVLYSV